MAEVARYRLQARASTVVSLAMAFYAKNRWTKCFKIRCTASGATLSFSFFAAQVWEAHLPRCHDFRWHLTQSIEL